MTGRRDTEDRERDTIVALATAPGRAALAVVRVSGPATRAVLQRVFARARGAPAMPARRPVLGDVLDRAGGAIDRGVALLFPAPRSYTGEDLAELTVHGAPPVVRELVAACVAAGARPARPGEFTLRALEAGKTDLARAEAVRDLVEAATLEQARIAARQAAGEVSDVVGPLAEEVLDLLADVEAGLDFAEEESHLVEASAAVARRAEELAARIGATLRASDLARRVREGARVVLLGPPNAGKSSLFNRLVGAERVIVTEEPGTTRDTVEETIVVDGLPVVLVDAAGVGEARGRADEEGMRRALAAAARADLVLEVHSLARPERPQGDPGERRLRVGTHADVAVGPPGPHTLAVSSTTGAGIEDLRAALGRLLEAPGARPLESVALATDRHRDAARRAAEALRRGAAIASRERRPGAEAELVAVELREAARALREIVGEVTPEDLLGRIFGRFCIGK